MGLDGAGAPNTHPGHERKATWRMTPGSDEAEIATLLATGLLPRSGGGFGLDQLYPPPGQGPGGARAVLVDYPAGSASAGSANLDGSSYGGAQAYLLLPYGPVDAARLSYCVRFPPASTSSRAASCRGCSAAA